MAAHRDPDDGVAAAPDGRSETLTLAANDDRYGSAKIGLASRQRGIGIRADDSEASDVQVRQRFGQIIDRDQEEVLHRPSRSLDGGGRKRRLAMGRVDDAVHSASLRGA